MTGRGVLRNAQGLFEGLVAVGLAVAAVVTLLDVLGLLDAGDVWRDWPAPLTKVTLVLVALLYVTIVVERRTDLAEIRRGLAAVRDLMRELSDGARTVRLLPTRAAVYKAITEALDEAPRGSEVLVTHFEKLAFPYATGEIPEERHLMEAWWRLVASGSLRVEQVVHIASRRDVRDVRDRIERFNDVPTYQLRALVDPATGPYLDLFVIRGRWAVVALPKEHGSPRVTDVGIEFTDAATVAALADYFGIVRDELAMPLKDRDRLHLQVIDELDQRLPEDFEPAALKQASDLALHLAGPGDAAQRVAALVAAYSQARAVDDEIVGDRADAAVADAVRRLQSLAGGEVVLDSKDMGAELLALTRRTRTSLEATSYLDNEQFWTSPAGRRLLHANRELCRAGRSVTRVFILTAADRGSASLWRAIREQVDAGIDVYVVDEEEVDPALRQDFLIRDGTLVVRDRTRRPGPGRPAAAPLYGLPTEPPAFGRLLAVATPFDEVLEERGVPAARREPPGPQSNPEERITHP